MQCIHQDWLCFKNKKKEICSVSEGKFFNILRCIALDFWNYLNVVFRIFAFIKNTWLCLLLPFAFLDCQNTVMLLKIYSRWVMRLLTVNCSIQNLPVEGGGSLKREKVIGDSLQGRQVIGLHFQSGGLNINMLCSKLEKSSLFMLSSSHIKSFRKKKLRRCQIAFKWSQWITGKARRLYSFSVSIFRLYCICLIQLK